MQLGNSVTQCCQHRHRAYRNYANNNYVMFIYSCAQYKVRLFTVPVFHAENGFMYSSIIYYQLFVHDLVNSR